MIAAMRFLLFPDNVVNGAAFPQGYIPNIVGMFA
jgi:hypothetical protein